jgi:hypothetical protein
MVYTINVFQQLVEKFPTWNALREFLVSPAGGSLKIIESGGENVILRYEKGVSDTSIPHVRWFRSVVWNKLTNRPLCVAPPKASTNETFPSSVPQSLYYQDYVDGVMINVYKGVGGPVLVTRSSFDATGTFYSERSFKELLADAMKVHEIASIDELIPDGFTFVSLLLQHPDHRIVEPVTVPKIYQIHAGRVLENGDVQIEEHDLEWAPLHLTYDPSMSVSQWIASLSEQRGWSWQGVTMKDQVGNRWRIRSNSYRMVRSLRGNTARDDVRFAQLFVAHLVDTYLYYYPEDTNLFRMLYIRLEATVKMLYDRYVRLHITKTLKPDHLEPMWKPHVFALHGFYLYSLRPNKHFVREKDVMNYVQALPWQQLLHIMNRRESVPVYAPDAMPIVS